MHIVITGADGFIGRHLVCRAIIDGHEVTAVTRRMRYSNKVKSVKCNILNPKMWADIFSDIHNVDAVIHLAAIMPDAVSVNVNDFDLGNYQFTKFLLDFFDKNASRTIPFIYFSSVGVVGTVTQNEIDESYYGDIANMHPYFNSKLAVENFIRGVNFENLDTYVFRLTSPYGHSMPTKSVLPVFVKNALEGRDLLWHGTGRRTQDFIHVNDVVEICMKSILMRPERLDRIIYLASGQRTEMKSLAKLISNLLDVPCGPSGRVDLQEDKTWRVNNSLVKEMFNFHSFIDLKTGVQGYIDACRSATKKSETIWWG